MIDYLSCVWDSPMATCTAACYSDFRSLCTAEGSKWGGWERKAHNKMLMKTPSPQIVSVHSVVCVEAFFPSWHEGSRSGSRRSGKWGWKWQRRPGSITRWEGQGEGAENMFGVLWDSLPTGASWPHFWILFLSSILSYTLNQTWSRDRHSFLFLPSPLTRHSPCPAKA